MDLLVTSCASRSTNNPDVHIDWVKYVAGAGSGFLQVAVPYPLHKLMFRQMFDGAKTAGAFRQLRKEGFFLLYRGIIPPFCQKGISNSIMFGSYHSYGSILKEKLPGVNLQLIKSFGAFLAGASEALLLVPFERVQTLLLDKHYNTTAEFKNTRHTFYHLYKNHGFTEFYRGGSTILVRNALSTILFFSAKEKVETILPDFNSVAPDLLLDFICGGLIGGTISSSVSYPLNVVKTRMQAQVGGSFDSPWKVFQIIFHERDRRWRKIFRGVHLNFTRSLLSWGIVNASYELISNFLRKDS